MQGVKELTSGPIRKQLFSLALPIMGTSFIQMAYTLTDMAWVGRISSEAAATIGSVGILTWIANSVSLLNKVGSEVSVGQSVGSHNSEDARNFASHNVTIATVISICLGGIFFLFAEPIIGIYKLDQHIASDAVSYLRIVSVAFPFVFQSAAFSGIYNASGRSKIPFFISGIGLILNMILDPIFIFVFDMGVQGAAYATLIAQGFVFLLFVYQLRHRDILLNRFPFYIRLKRKYTLHVFKIGLPVATFNTLFAFVNMFMGRTASEYGGHIGLMSLTTGGQIEAINWTTSQGLSTALSTFVAQNYAARKADRVNKAWYTTLWMTLLFGSFCSLLFILGGSEFFSIFVPESEAYQAGGVFLRISGYSQMFMMLEITTQGIFYGLGRTMPPATISIVCNYARIPLAVLFARMGMGVEGIWWAISVTSIAKGVILATWFLIIRKKVLQFK